VAVAAALKADVCEIYTDVDGVYTADPNVVPTAHKVQRISYEEMLELASLGAKVLQIRSVEFGMKFGVPIHVRSSFNDNEGTWVVPEEKAMEAVVVAGVTATRDEAKITVVGISDAAGIQARVFKPLADAGIVVDVIVQALAPRATPTSPSPCPRATSSGPAICSSSTAPTSAPRTTSSPRTGLSKVSVVGVGMRSHAGVA
jgi:aspartate kinase